MNPVATTHDHIRIGLMTLVFALPAGCALDTSDDGDEFREAVPETTAIRLAGPEDEAATPAPSSSLESVDQPWADGPWAKYYAFTRYVRDGINGVTVGVLGGVWYVIHTRPSDVSAGTATWGPWTDDLSPVTARFRVTRNDDGSYRYLLEGKPRGAGDDAYRTVLDGVGYRKNDARHGQGGFTVDLDAAKALDPLKNPNGGQVRIDHQLPREPGAVPRTITARATTGGEQWWTATSHQTANGGTLLVDAHTDLDPTELTALEDVQIASQWRGSGAGRADLTLSGGDIPESLGVVTAVECWGTDFMRVYYTDSVNYQPTEGSAGACAFSAAPQS
jgi:hypothetical protein